MYSGRLAPVLNKILKIINSLEKQPGECEPGVEELWAVIQRVGRVASHELFVELEANRKKVKRMEVKPCPSDMLDSLKRKYERNPVQHFVVWDKTYYLNEEGSCKVLDYVQYRNLRRCDGYDINRYEVLASIGGP